MPTTDTFEKTPAEPALLRIAGGVAGLAASAYVTQAWMTDSPYWNELSHRPLAMALWATVSLVDWSGGVKLVVVLGTSLAVMIDSGRRLFARRPPRLARRPSPRASRAFSLEAAR